MKRRIALPEEWAGNAPAGTVELGEDGLFFDSEGGRISGPVVMHAIRAVPNTEQQNLVWLHCLDNKLFKVADGEVVEASGDTLNGLQQRIRQILLHMQSFLQVRPHATRGSKPATPGSTFGLSL